MKNLQIYIPKDVHCGIVSNGKELEATWNPTSMGMVKSIKVFPYYEM